MSERLKVIFTLEEVKVNDTDITCEMKCVNADTNKQVDITEENVMRPAPMAAALILDMLQKKAKASLL